MAFSDKLQRRRADIEAKEERKAKLAGPLTVEESAKILSEWFVGEKEINDNDVHESGDKGGRRRPLKPKSRQAALSDLDAEFDLYLQEIGRAM